MAERRTGLYYFLNFPIFYSFLQKALGRDRVSKWIVDDLVRPQDGASILDLGCGAGDILIQFKASLTVSYTGIDMSERHIKTATSKFQNRHRFLSGDCLVLVSQLTERFDLVMAIGFLHPLDDGQAQNLTRAIVRRLKPGGRFLSLDPVYHDGQSPISRFLASIDSGKHVRTEIGYRRLFEQNFERVKSTIYTAQLNVPYSHCVIEATNPVQD